MSSSGKPNGTLSKKAFLSPARKPLMQSVVGIASSRTDPSTHINTAHDDLAKDLTDYYKQVDDISSRIALTLKSRQDKDCIDTEDRDNDPVITKYDIESTIHMVETSQAVHTNDIHFQLESANNWIQSTGKQYKQMIYSLDLEEEDETDDVDNDNSSEGHYNSNSNSVMSNSKKVNEQKLRMIFAEAKKLYDREYDRITGILSKEMKKELQNIHIKLHDMDDILAKLLREQVEYEKYKEMDEEIKRMTEAKYRRPIIDMNSHIVNNLEVISNIEKSIVFANKDRERIEGMIEELSNKRLKADPFVHQRAMHLVKSVLDILYAKEVEAAEEKQLQIDAVIARTNVLKDEAKVLLLQCASLQAESNAVDQQIQGQQEALIKDREHWRSISKELRPKLEAVEAKAKKLTFIIEEAKRIERRERYKEYKKELLRGNSYRDKVVGTIDADTSNSVTETVTISADIISKIRADIIAHSPPPELLWPNPHITSVEAASVTPMTDDATISRTENTLTETVSAVVELPVRSAVCAGIYGLYRVMNKQHGYRHILRHKGAGQKRRNASFAATKRGNADSSSHSHSHKIIERNTVEYFNSLSFNMIDAFTIIDRIVAELRQLDCISSEYMLSMKDNLSYIKKEYKMLSSGKSDVSGVESTLRQYILSIIAHVYLKAPTAILVGNEVKLMGQVVMHVLALVSIIQNTMHVQWEHPLVVSKDGEDQMESLSTRIISYITGNLLTSTHTNATARSSHKSNSYTVEANDFVSHLRADIIYYIDAINSDSNHRLSVDISAVEALERFVRTCPINCTDMTCINDIYAHIKEGIVHQDRDDGLLFTLFHRNMVEMYELLLLLSTSTDAPALTTNLIDHAKAQLVNGLYVHAVGVKSTSQVVESPVSTTAVAGLERLMVTVHPLLLPGIMSLNMFKRTLEVELSRVDFLCRIGKNVSPNLLDLNYLNVSATAVTNSSSSNSSTEDAIANDDRRQILLHSSKRDIHIAWLKDVNTCITNQIKDIHAIIAMLPTQQQQQQRNSISGTNTMCATAASFVSDKLRDQTIRYAENMHSIAKQCMYTALEGGFTKIGVTSDHAVAIMQQSNILNDLLIDMNKQKSNIEHALQALLGPWQVRHRYLKQLLDKISKEKMCLSDEYDAIQDDIYDACDSTNELKQLLHVYKRTRNVNDIDIDVLDEYQLHTDEDAQLKQSQKELEAMSEQVREWQMKEKICVNELDSVKRQESMLEEALFILQRTATAAATVHKSKRGSGCGNNDTKSKRDSTVKRDSDDKYRRRYRRGNDDQQVVAINDRITAAAVMTSNGGKSHRFSILGPRTRKLLLDKLLNGDADADAEGTFSLNRIGGRYYKVWDDASIDKSDLHLVDDASNSNGDGGGDRSIKVYDTDINVDTIIDTIVNMNESNIKMRTKLTTVNEEQAAALDTAVDVAGDNYEVFPTKLVFGFLPGQIYVDCSAAKAVDDATTIPLCASVAAEVGDILPSFLVTVTDSSTNTSKRMHRTANTDTNTSNSRGNDKRVVTKQHIDQTSVSIGTVASMFQQHLLNKLSDDNKPNPPVRGILVNAAAAAAAADVSPIGKAGMKSVKILEVSKQPPEPITYKNAKQIVSDYVDSIDASNYQYYQSILSSTSNNKTTNSSRDDKIFDDALSDVYDQLATITATPPVTAKPSYIQLSPLKNRDRSYYSVSSNH